MQAEHAGNDARASWRRWLPRFSLRELLLATTFVAVGCYALRWASPWWSIVLFYANVLAILGGLLVAINWSSEPRSFWLGFAVCGLAHWLLAFHLGFSNGHRPLHYREIVTTQLTRWLYHTMEANLTVAPRWVSKVEYDLVDGGDGGLRFDVADNFRYPEPRPYLKAGVDGRFYGVRGGAQYLGVTRYLVSEQHFIDVGVGLWTMLLGYLGGRLSLVLYRCRGRAVGANGG